MNTPPRSAIPGSAAGRRARRALAHASVGALWYLFFAVLVPVGSLAVYGLLTLWREGQLIVLVGIWLLITALGYAAFIGLPRFRARREHKARARLAAGTSDEHSDSSESPADDALPDQLEARSDWSARDREIWAECVAAIDARLDTPTDWDELPDVALDQLALVATRYHGDRRNARWRFTLPEALLVITVASDRYRRLIMRSVPFAERITVASLVSLYDRQTQLQTSYTWFNRVRRTVRLINPMAAALGELRDQVTGRVFDHVSLSFQTDLKRMLLQEIAQVGIDLYSGRLKVSDAELRAYRSAAVREDESRRVDAIEPLRVVLLGQTSAGKSSLVNALIESLAAETDRLPTTDRLTVHEFATSDGLRVHLVDTRGNDGSDAQQKSLVRSAEDADLIVWLCRATQPARDPDHQLLQRIRQWFDRHPERRLPPILLAMTHIDQLKPRGEWSPPYPLDAESSKARSIREALISVRDQIGLDPTTPAVPVCLSTSREHYNVDRIGFEIMAMAESATLTQMNRRRIERGRQSVSWKARLQQTSRLGRAFGRSLTRR